MKHFTPALWLALQDGMVDEAQWEAWEKAAREYNNYFQGVLDKLPKTYLAQYQRRARFHDMTITKMATENFRNDVFDFYLYLEDRFAIKYHAVRALSVQIPAEHGFLGGKMSWGYDEYEYLDGAGWTHRILCDLVCEIEITCKKLSWIRL